jgi:hypothetical protein
MAIACGYRKNNEAASLAASLRGGNDASVIGPPLVPPVHCPFLGADVLEQDDAILGIVLGQAAASDGRELVADVGRVHRPFLGTNVLEQHGAGIEIFLGKARRVAAVAGVETGATVAAPASCAGW